MRDQDGDIHGNALQRLGKLRVGLWIHGKKAGRHVAGNPEELCGQKPDAGHVRRIVPVYGCFEIGDQIKGPGVTAQQILEVFVFLPHEPVWSQQFCEPVP